MKADEAINAIVYYGCISPSGPRCQRSQEAEAAIREAFAQAAALDLVVEAAHGCPPSENRACPSDNPRGATMRECAACWRDWRDGLAPCAKGVSTAAADRARAELATLEAEAAHSEVTAYRYAAQIESLKRIIGEEGSQ